MIVAPAAADAGPPDRVVAGIAVLGLLSDLTQRSPVLVVADDLQWVDAESLAVLSFTARRIEDEPLHPPAGRRRLRTLDQAAGTRWPPGRAGRGPVVVRARAGPAGLRGVAAPPASSPSPPRRTR